MVGKLSRKRNKMKNFLKETWNKLAQNPDKLFYAFLFAYFILMIVLCFFRDMIKDESFYYRETWLISELIKNGEWIGDYSVGLHGFLFKLPPALIFLLTGPSIEVVTIYTILIGMLVGFFFFKLVKNILQNSKYAFVSTIFLMTSFHFVLSMPTYLRDIPSLLIIVMFMYGVLKNWNKYLMSFAFLLLLDSKEYVFLVFAVFYVIWIFLTSKEPTFFKKVWDITKTSFIVFLPSLIWIVLMFTTSIIPVNMYFASTFGLINEDLDYLLKHFSTELAASNLVEGGREISQISKEGVTSSLLCTLIDIYNFVMVYIGKLLYPRSFSFLSVPKVVIFPIVFSSIVLVKEFFQKKKNLRIFTFSAFLILVWLFFYILRTSHGRYLLPIVPLISIILIYTFFFSEFSKKQKLLLIIGTGIYVLLGFYFEASFVVPKILIEMFLLLLLTVSILKPSLHYLRGIFIPTVSIITLGVSLLFSYTQGQIFGYLNYGKNRSVEKVAEELPYQEKFWGFGFDNGDLISVVNKEIYLNPEKQWELKDIVPKKAILKSKGEQYSYYFEIYYDHSTQLYDFAKFKKNIQENNIKKVVILENEDSETEGVKNVYDYFYDFDWLDFEKEEKVGNTTIIIFSVKE